LKGTRLISTPLGLQNHNVAHGATDYWLLTTVIFPFSVHKPEFGFVYALVGM